MNASRYSKGMCFGWQSLGKERRDSSERFEKGCGERVINWNLSERPIEVEREWC